jgi:hypothetical protein
MANTKPPVPANNRYFLGSDASMRGFVRFASTLDGVTVFANPEEFSVRLQVEDMRKVGTKIWAAYQTLNRCDGEQVDYLTVAA